MTRAGSVGLGAGVRVRVGIGVRVGVGVGVGVVGLVTALAAACSSRSVEVVDTIDTYDWCAPVVVRPEVRVDPPDCTPAWSQAEIAVGAKVVLLGGGHRYDPELELRRRGRCGHDHTHADNAKYIEEVNALRARNSDSPVRFHHMTRFDLVLAGHAGLPGFSSDFLLRTDTPVSQVRAFFETDRSGACAEAGCEWSFDRWDKRHHKPAASLRRRIASMATDDVADRVVYYVGRAGPEDTVFGPMAVVADLRIPAYRAWRVKRAAAELARGGYDAMILNEKFFQYYMQVHYLNSTRYPDVASLGRSTPFTAPPKDYGFAEYVAGWGMLAADLRAAGVPYAIKLQPHPWLTSADDPRTPVDERETILDVVQRASHVLFSKATLGGQSIAHWRALLSARGAPVMLVNTRCKYGR